MAKPDLQQIDDFVHNFNDDPDAAIEAIRKREVSHPYLPSDTNASTLHTSPLISVSSLSKSYLINRQIQPALHDVTFTIGEGEFIALTGPSGSGKSTLLQLIGALDQPTSGTIAIDGTDINQLSDKQRSKFRNKTIGFVFQFFYLQPFLTVGDNVEIPGMFAGTNRKERHSHAANLMEKVGLSGQSELLPKQLSGGQIQRSAIARALLNRPKILLADEPTGNLDSVNSKVIIDLFRQIRNELGTTVIIVTHDQEIARQTDREIHLKDGAIT